jgi:UDP-glucose 4-epimerase
MKYLVTGGAGFIGSHLVDRLISEKHNVIVIDNESASENEHFYWNDSAENYKHDICDYDKIKYLFRGIDCVFHLAAESRIQTAIKNPAKTFKVNFIGTLNILEASRLYDVKRVIYSSTSSYYGLKNQSPLVESMDRDCLNPYSSSKVAGEDIVRMYSKLYGIESIIFRYFNVYGERQPTKGQYAPVIGLFQKMKSEGKPMTVVGDGLARRDYTHVKDVVEANVLAAMKEELSESMVINIGTGKNYSVLDLVKLIDGEYIHIPPREGEAKETLADISIARRYLNWKPSINLKDWIKNK